MGLECGVISTGATNEKVFIQISAHKTDHIIFLTNGIGGVGSPNFVKKPTMILRLAVLLTRFMIIRHF